MRSVATLSEGPHLFKNSSARRPGGSWVMMPSIHTSAHGLAPPHLTRTVGKSEFPVSFNQLSRLLRDRRAVEAGIDLGPHHVAGAVRVRGLLDFVALGAALQDVVDRHGALRTTFHPTEDNEWIQRVHESLTPEIVRLRASDLSAAIAVGSTEAARRFNLAVSSPVRMTVVELAEHDHLVILAVEHVAADGWSLGVIAREMSALYDNRRSRSSALLPHADFQFGDFAVWERSWITGDVEEGLVAVWREILAGTTPCPHVALPELDVRADGTKPFRSITARVSLDGQVFEGIRAAARENRASLFMIVLAAFKAVACRYSENGDIGVVTPMSNRSAPELHNCVGWFANLIALRTLMDDGWSVEDLTRAVRSTVLVGFEYEFLPMPVLLRALDPSTFGYVQSHPYVSFNYLPPRAPGSFPLKLGTSRIDPVPLDFGVARRGLAVTVLESVSALEFIIKYERDRYASAMMDDFVADYVETLSEVSRRNPRAIRDLPMANAAKYASRKE